MTGRALIAVPGVILSLMLGGCGGSEKPSGSETAGESSQSSVDKPTESGTPAATTEPGFDVSTAKLPTDPFCDSVDKARVADLLGLAVGQVKLLDDRRVGDKYTPMPGQPKLTSTVNLCSFGTPEAQLLVAAMPGRTPADLEKTVAIYRTMDDPKATNSDVCTVADEPSVGDHGTMVSCEGNLEGNKGQVSVLLTGLLEGGGFSCQTVIRQGSTPKKLDEPARQTCLSIIKTVTGG